MPFYNDSFNYKIRYLSHVSILESKTSMIVIVRLSSFVINLRFLSFKSAGAYWIDHIWYFVVSYLIANESFYTMMMMLQEKMDFLTGLNLRYYWVITRELLI